MSISEFSEERAELINKFNIPDIMSPVNIKFLWFYVLSANHAKHSLFSGAHSHSFYEIHFVFSGKVYYEYDNEVIAFNKNEALFISSECLHKYKGCSDDSIKVSLAFSPDDDLGKKLFSEISTQKFSFDSCLSESVNFILKSAKMDNFFIPHLVSGRMLEILSFVCSTLNTPVPSYEKEYTDTRFLVAKKYINTNKNRLISCEDVAKECCLSKRQLNRIFLQNAGKSLSTYITDTKTKYAEELLTNTRLSIKEISFMLGFKNESSFVLFFKRRFDVPPGIYRNRMSQK